MLKEGVHFIGTYDECFGNGVGWICGLTASFQFYAAVSRGSRNTKTGKLVLPF